MAEVKYPEPGVGVIIYKKEKILLTRNPEWKDVWVIPGGHVETGETSKETVKREIKEETNLEVDEIKFIGFEDGVYPERHINKKHFIFLYFSARLKDGKVKKSNEVIDYLWIEPKKALKTLKIDEYSIKAIQYFLEQKEEGEEDFKHKYLHALADYQNLIKRTEIEKQEFIKYANERLLTEILPVYDNLKLALLHANPEKSGLDDANAVMEGVKHVLSQFKNVLENLGVKEIKTIGEKFDHHSMEAVEKKETDDKKKDDIVESEIMPGYELGDKVIRAARVVVYEYQK